MTGAEWFINSGPDSSIVFYNYAICKNLNLYNGPQNLLKYVQNVA